MRWGVTMKKFLPDVSWHLFNKKPLKNLLLFRFFRINVSLAVNNSYFSFEVTHNRLIEASVNATIELEETEWEVSS